MIGSLSSVFGRCMPVIGMTLCALPAHAATVNISASADTYASLNKPDDTFGSNGTLQVRSSTNLTYARVAYFKFDVNTFTQAPISAKVRIHSSNLAGAVSLHDVVDDTWGEATLTWNTRPALGAQIGSAVAVAGDWFEIDVTAHVSAGGTYSVALEEDYNVMTQIHSKESAYVPELVLEFADASLSAEEVAQIEGAFGVTLTSQEITDLANVVNPVYVSGSWLSDANARIDQNRMSDLSIEVVDSLGLPISNASVSVQLSNPDFKWGATVKSDHFTNSDGSLRITTDRYKDILKIMFNSIGFNNSLKPRLTGLHDQLPGALSWAQANDMPVRGHLLIWPGTGTPADLDDPTKVLGTDYGKHLSQSSTSDFASYDVAGAIATYGASARSQADKDAVEAEANAEIQEWVSQWDVYEWDVINETLTNHLLMDILGYDQMAEWFKIADANKVSSDTNLFINDYQIISAMSEELNATKYIERRDGLMANVDQIISDGGPIDGIGFQSRIGLERRDPQLIWDRLEEWGNRYELPMVGTEFEVVDSELGTTYFPYFYTDNERAEITHEMMMQYYSHPLVSGFSAWNFLHDESKSLIDYDGNLKLNGLVWYYLRHIRFATDEASTTGSSGLTNAIRCFNGELEITVTYDGTDYVLNEFVDTDASLQIVLYDVVTNTPPVWNNSPYTAQDAAEDVAYSRYINWVASDADGDTLTFSASLLPAWASLSSSGRITGTPTQSDVGSHMMLVEVSDGISPPVQNTVYIDVLNTNDAPVFLSDPILLADANEASAYAGSIAGSATDEDGDALIYSKVSGTEWLTVASDGTLSGTPSSADVGSLSFIVAVDDGNGASTLAELQINVEAVVNLAPTWSQDPFTTTAAVEDVLYTKWINYMINDPEGDTLTHEIISGPSWFSLTNPETGRYDGTPSQSDVGLHEIVVSITDGINPPVQATWHLTVTAVNDAPVFNNAVIVLSNGAEGVSYAGSIAGNATNEEGDALSYTKLSGPSWLSIASDGAVSGTPTGADLDLNTFTIEVSDGNGGTDQATLEVSIDVAPPVWSDLVFDDFEAGFGHWIDAGSDAQLSAVNALDAQGLFLRDNSSTSEVVLSEPLDLTAKTDLNIDFSYVVDSFEGAEDFWVSYSSDVGATWTVLRAFVNDVDFVDDGTRYDPTISINSSTHSFSDNVQIKFECDASGNGDRLYIDNIRISAL